MTKQNSRLNDRHIEDLKELGRRIDVKVSTGLVRKGRDSHDLKQVIWIRDFEFDNFKDAALYLRHCASELLENREYLVG